MNIDERLDALTQSVELLAGMQIDAEKRMTQLVEVNISLQDSVAKLTSGMEVLTRVAIDHDDRLNDLEGKRPQ